MKGSHPRQEVAGAARTYALLVDITGEDESGLEGADARASDPKKDSTAVTVIEVEAPTGGINVSPSYRVVNRYVWTGVKHPALYGPIVGLAKETWRARYVVVDATGIGAAVASFLDKALPGKVIPFVFTSSSKSELGWNFCGIIDSGCYKEYADDGAEDTRWFWRQLGAVEYEVRPGPGQLLSWSVPDPRLHDDLVMSAALAAVLDGQDFRPRKATGSSREGW